MVEKERMNNTDITKKGKGCTVTSNSPETISNETTQTKVYETTAIGVQHPGSQNSLAWLSHSDDAGLLMVTVQCLPSPCLLCK